MSDMGILQQLSEFLCKIDHFFDADCCIMHTREGQEPTRSRIERGVCET